MSSVSSNSRGVRDGAFIGLAMYAAAYAIALFHAQLAGATSSVHLQELLAATTDVVRTLDLWGLLPAAAVGAVLGACPSVLAIDRD
jgi:hypothetical protein